MATIIPALGQVANLGALGADPSVSAAAAAGQGLQDIGQGVQRLGEGLATLQQKRQQAIDIGAKASVRLAIQKATEDFENWKAQNPDKEGQWEEEYTKRVGSIRGNLPEGVSGDAMFEMDADIQQAEGTGALRVRGQAAARGVQRARTQVGNAVDAYIAAGDAEGAIKQINEGTGTLWTPEERDAMIAKVKPKAEANEVERMIAVDPFTVSKSLGERGEDGKPLHFQNLDEGTRAQLLRQAETRVSGIRSDRFNQVMVDTLQNNWMTKDQAIGMAERGEWTYGQAYAYLNQLENRNSGAEKYDNAQYNDIYTGIQSYDPKGDVTGKTAADMAAGIAASQLSPAHKKELMDKLNERRDGTGKALGGDKNLETHISGIVKERFDAGRLGTWMVDDDNDEDTPMVQDQAAWESANDKRFQIIQDWKEWYKDNPNADLETAKKALDTISGFKQRSRGFKFQPKSDGFNRIDQQAPAGGTGKAAGEDGSTSYNLPAPLKPYESTFIEAAEANNLDPAFLMAISMHETGKGTSSAFSKKNNLMGVSNSSGPISFSRPEDSIWRMAKVLANPSGPYKNAKTIREVAAVYAPVGAENDPRGLNSSWTGGVTKYYTGLKGGGDDTAFVASRSGSAKFINAAGVAKIDVNGKSWGEVQDDYFALIGGGAVADVDGDLASLRLRWMDQLVITGEKKARKGGDPQELELPSGGTQPLGQGVLPPLS